MKSLSACRSDQSTAGTLSQILYAQLKGGSAVDCEEAPFAGGALQRLHAAVGELEAGTDHELAHGAGDEDFARAGQRAYTGADVDRHAADVVADQLDLAVVDAGPHLEPEPRQLSLHRPGAADCPGGAVEGG